MQDLHGDLVILVGDAPLIKKTTIESLIKTRRAKAYACVFLSAVYNDPPPYGRVIRDKNNNVARIVEEKDASESEKNIKEVCSSHYCFYSDHL